MRRRADRDDPDRRDHLGHRLDAHHRHLGAARHRCQPDGLHVPGRQYRTRRDHRRVRHGRGHRHRDGDHDLTPVPACADAGASCSGWGAGRRQEHLSGGHACPGWN